jgi:hypothetical protein
MLSQRAVRRGAFLLDRLDLFLGLIQRFADRHDQGLNRAFFPLKPGFGLQLKLT